MIENQKTRRQFLKGAAAAGAGLTILPSGTRAGVNAPSNKLNIGLIGAWGRAAQHWSTLRDENVVAVCDVREKHLNIGLKGLGNPKAATYKDWRQMLDKQKDLDAVFVCTPDHQHAHIANWALNRDLHVYLEKPIGNCVQEARTVREKWISKGKKVATQVGTQRHAKSNFARIRELVRDGMIGDLQEAFAWGNRTRVHSNYPKATTPVPADLDQDLWCGPSPLHPYSNDYWTKLISNKPVPGMNCLSWNQFWDFGSGQVGDMGSHTMDLVWNAIDADRPTSASAKGEAVMADVAPGEFQASYMVPANDWRGEIRVSWWQGGLMPRSPSNWVDLNKIGHGAMFRGTKGMIIADFHKRLILPVGKELDMTYYSPRKEEALIPELGNFQKEWTNACKGDLKTSCDFDYNGRMMEMMFLGLAAYRAGEEVTYDAKTGTTDKAATNAFLSKKYREGWPIDA